MGGGGLLSPVTNLLFGKAPSAPAAPDYSGAAQQTAQGNIDAARQATAANRVNQITPYGRLDYSITGADPYGNPTWTATQSLSPEQKRLLDLQNQTSIGLGELQGKGLNYVESMLNSPFNTAALPSTGFNPSQSYQDAYMQRLQPQIQQTREAMQQRLANQGIDIGSTAYDRAMQSQAQRENDLLLGATTQGFGVGQQARQSALQEQAYLRNEPLNTLNAVRSGAQVTGPQFVNSAQQATTAGPDLLGAAQMGYNAQMGGYNAQAADRNNMMQGLFSLGGAAMMAPAGTFSDIRTKENIEKIGIAKNGLPVYVYEYKEEFKNDPMAGHGKHIGHMAHEVEKVYPNAVTILDDGYKVVNYGLLP
jgi:hypothetical protein